MSYRLIKNTLLWSCLLLAVACLRFENPYTKLPPGEWRAVLYLDPKAISPNPKGEYREDKLNLTFDEVTNGELPFNIEVEYTDDTTFQLFIINGEERIPAEHISFGRSKSRAKDSIRIDFPVYDTYIVGLHEGGLIEGDWYVNYREEYSIPFEARFGQNHRFTKIPKEPVLDLSGRWEVTFGQGTEDDPYYPGIGEFTQNGSQLSGTFRTETGDYRFLKGQVSGNKVYLSVFDGAHAFLFEARIDETDETMVGSFRSGKHYRTAWTAKRNSEAILKSPYDLTQVNDGDVPFDFTFLSVDGDSISLSDPAYQGKAKLVQIMGTWCPNCKDETRFLLDYFSENNYPDLQLFTIGFERYRDADRSLAALERYRDLWGVPYPVLWGGYHNKTEASLAMPQLNKIISYPTLLFIDRDNQVRKVHTGFNGPATSEYQDFVRTFDSDIKALVASEL